MQIKKVGVKNFRLLRDAELFLDNGTTLVVGRNNSGKTSLAELFRRLLSDGTPTFRLEDFSHAARAGFRTAYELARAGKDDADVRAALPVIEVTLVLGYEASAASLGVLSEFVVDLDTACTEARADIRYELEPGKLRPFFDFDGIGDKASEDEFAAAFLRAMKEAVPKHYKCGLKATDPNDPTNQKALDWSRLRALIQGDLVTAQRGLDDITDKDNDSLGKILGVLFDTAGAELADETERARVAALKTAVRVVEKDIDDSFNGQLTGLLPALDLFGYRLPDPKLRTETTLDVGRLLKNHTKIRYSGADGVHLPEAYNGLGARNLIYMLLKLYEAFKSFRAKAVAPCVHVIFIEEPEAHLHPQMQEVFIGKLQDMAALFARDHGGGTAWPVQFVVTTHSAHMANKASFDAIRYFLSAPDEGDGGTLRTHIRDLKRNFGDRSDGDNEFLHQYMTLTRCDLLFADKVILIEGTSERLLLPRMTEKIDAGLSLADRLGSQYFAVLEVGGAYAHLFFKLLDFLELPALVITDLDSVDAVKSGEACMVSVGAWTSNATIRAWFDSKSCSPAELVAKDAKEKTKGARRLAYQVPETDGGACGRSFEAAFMLANSGKFGLDDAKAEQSAWDLAAKAKKSEFALKHAIVDTAWVVPKYVADGLTWLGAVGRPAVAPAAAAASAAPAKKAPKRRGGKRVAAPVEAAEAVTIEISLSKDGGHGE